MLIKLRNYIVAGIIVLLPAAVTIYFLYFLFSFLDGSVGRFVSRIVGWDIPGLGVLLTLGVVLLAGLLASSIIGRAIIHSGEKLMTRIPIVKPIYITVKKVVDAFQAKNKEAFKRVVLVEYPRKGIYALAFTTGETKGEVQDKTHKTLINVFLPTTPNPTSGYFLLVPKEELIFLEMSVEDGLKMIISGGIVVPPPPAGEQEEEIFEHPVVKELWREKET